MSIFASILRMAYKLSGANWAFPAARKYPKECRQTRIDIEKRMCRVLAEWKGVK